MLAIAPDLLADVAAGRRVAIVSATNGKTTTTRLLAEALRAAGTAVVSNHTGANMPAGVAAALGRDRDAPVAVLEVDERWVPKVVDPLGTELLVLGNLTRDQLDRFGEVRSIATRWRDVCATHPDLAVVANASDPHVVWSVRPARHVTWVALGAPWRSDAATCPECAALLTWTADRFDCPACGFAQPDAAYRLDGDTLRTPDGPVELGLALPGDWNRMNAGARAHGGGHALRRRRRRARSAGMRAVEVVSGRFSAVRLPDGRDARVLLAKNPAGWTEVLRWLEPRATQRGPRGERPRRRRPRPVVAVGRAVRAAARQGRRRERRARARRRGAARLRRRRPSRRAGSGRRGRGAPGRRPRDRVVHAVHPPHPGPW